jgi:hypothetical protein
MGAMDFLFGKTSQEKTKPIYNPQQEDLLNQIMNALSGPLASGTQNLQNILGGDQETFDAFERPARRAFEQQTLPTIAERFTGSLGEGSQRSSAFGQAIGSAGRELEEDLFSKRIGMQGDALSQLIGLLGPATTPRQHEYTTDRKPGFLENAILSLLSGVRK